MNLTRREVIERVCELTKEVADHIGYDHPTDCFCGTGQAWRESFTDDDFRHAGKTIEYIERVVRASLVGAETVFSREDRSKYAEELEALAERIGRPSTGEPS